MLTKGQKIADYVIDSDSHIGSGNFSLVYRAINEANKQAVALKICKSGIAALDTERFNRENDILYKLHIHKRIIEPYSKVFAQEGFLCYAMELAFCNLESYLLTNWDKLSVDDKLELFKKICEGVSYAHKKKVVHRDLWWNNILLISRENINEPKLCDFGRAKDFDNKDSGYYLPQTVEVANVIFPPENYFLIWKKAELEKYTFADIYALGIILFFIFRNAPTLYHQAIQSNFIQFITQQGLQIQDLRSLSVDDRKKFYDKWKNQPGLDDLAKSHLKLDLPSQQQEEKINSIINKLCHPDYKERYSNADLLLTDLNNI
jgi:serine/threonine protein kinase